MAILRSLFAIKTFLFLIYSNVTGQQAMLPRSLPEAEGVSSDSVLRFIDAAAKSKAEFHSFMLVRHGKVIAEGWWNPYRSDLKHTLYSCSKSFTATAIGFAVQEKLLSVNDKVISFFPDDLPDTISPYLADLTVKDALMMSDGQEPDPTGVIWKNNNWVKAFLATPIKYDPGTRFLYNSLGTYMLSAIVQKVTGQRTIDYLKPRLFEPLGIQDMDWETDSKGINTGGWGLRIKTEDMAKFAQLFLQKGNWKGKQILPAAWIEEASTAKIMQEPDAPQSKRESNDWVQGYCYQMWRCRNNAYRGDGAYGQYMIVMPEQDAVLAITSETPDMQEELNMVWQYLLPAFKNNKLPENPKAVKKLKERINALALPVPSKNNSALENKIAVKNFKVAPNDKHLENISFSFNDGICRVTLKTDTAQAYLLDFGAGKWQPSITSKAGPSLTGTALEDRSMLYPAKIMGSYTWKNENTLQLVLRYIESPHTETYTCNFSKDSLVIEVERSLDFGRNKMQLQANVVD